MTTEVRHRIHHNRFGDLDVPGSAVLHFEGLPGFPDVRRLALVEHDRRSPFCWLVSLDDPDLAFVVTEPRHFFADYAPEPQACQLRAIGIEGDESFELLAIATLSSGACSLNLAAPILVNPRTRRAAQAILDGQHPVKAALEIEPVPPTRADAGSDRVEAPHVDRRG